MCLIYETILLLLRGRFLNKTLLRCNWNQMAHNKVVQKIKLKSQEQNEKKKLYLCHFSCDAHWKFIQTQVIYRAMLLSYLRRWTYTKYYMLPLLTLACQTWVEAMGPFFVDRWMWVRRKKVSFNVFENLEDRRTDGLFYSTPLAHLKIWW